MAHGGLPLIDWAAPWCAPYRALGQPMAEVMARAWGQATEAGSQTSQEGLCASALNAPAGWATAQPVRFVPQSDLPDGVAYETHIRRTARVPTRDNLHDFFNGLCWWHFPATKQRLNQWQAQAIEQAGAKAGVKAGGQGVRGPLRDALTLFDENAALLHAPEPLWQALRQRDWPRLFGPLRPMWVEARLVLFGHALLEKLVSPYKSITAHVLCLPMPALPASTAEYPAGHPHPWDGWLAERLSPAWLATKPYTPLPVLGVPGWWPDNESAGFYDDPGVFRPPRAAQGHDRTP